MRGTTSFQSGRSMTDAIFHNLLSPGPEMDELARLLQQHTALCQCSDMQVRGALEWMSQRGFRIVRPGTTTMEGNHD